jgi:hypothetical protein
LIEFLLISIGGRDNRISITLQGLIQLAGFIDSGPQWKATITAHRDEIRQLKAALSREAV